MHSQVFAIVFLAFMAMFASASINGMYHELQPMQIMLTNSPENMIACQHTTLRRTAVSLNQATFLPDSKLKKHTNLLSGTSQHTGEQDTIQATYERRVKQYYADADRKHFNMLG